MKTLTAFGRVWIIIRRLPGGYECAWIDQPARRELISTCDIERMG